MEFLDREGDCIQFSIDAVTGNLREFANGRLVLAPVPWVEYSVADGTISSPVSTHRLLEQGCRAELALGIRALTLRAGAEWRGDQPEPVRRLVLADADGYRLEFLVSDASMLQLYYNGELVSVEVSTLVFSVVAGTLSEGSRLFVLPSCGSTQKVAVLRLLAEEIGVMWCGDDPLLLEEEGGSRCASPSSRPGSSRHATFWRQPRLLDIENCAVDWGRRCPKRWGNLMPTERPNERFCKSCQDIVYLCTTAAERQEHASQRKCVVFYEQETPVSPSNATSRLMSPLAGSPSTSWLTANLAAAAAAGLAAEERHQRAASVATSTPSNFMPVLEVAQTEPPALPEFGSAQIATAWIDQVVQASLQDADPAEPYLADETCESVAAGDTEVAEVEEAETEIPDAEAHAEAQQLMEAAIAGNAFETRLMPAETAHWPEEAATRWAWASGATAELDCAMRWAWGAPADAAPGHAEAHAPPAALTPARLEATATGDRLPCSPLTAVGTPVSMYAEMTTPTGDDEPGAKPDEQDEPVETTDSEEEEEAASEQATSSEEMEEDIVIHVVRLDGSDVAILSMSPSATVHQVKQLLAVEVYIPVGQQRLVYREHILQDDLLLSEAGIESEALVNLIHVRPPLRSRHPSKGARAVGSSSRGRYPLRSVGADLALPSVPANTARRVLNRSISPRSRLFDPSPPRMCDP